MDNTTQKTIRKNDKRIDEKITTTVVRTAYCGNGADK